MLIDVWDGTKYDGHITTLDSTDACGWIGTFDPITSSNWIQGNVIGHSPLGWDRHNPDHHYWGPFPQTVTEAHANSWIVIPAAYSIQGEVDLGRDPFFVSFIFYVTMGGCPFGWEPSITPYHCFHFYVTGVGPDGQHTGWFIRSISWWIEVIVNYYTNMPPNINDVTALPCTFSPGPFSVEAQITDLDGEDLERGGIASAYLHWIIENVADSTAMQGPAEGGEFTGQIPTLAVVDTVQYYVTATDSVGSSTVSDTVAFAILEPKHPEADILVIWDDEWEEELDTFFVDLFVGLDTQYDFELWNIQKRNGIDASVINWGWSTIYISGWGCQDTLPGRDYADNPFVEWLEAGTTDEPHNLLYVDQDYYCVHPEYDCDWDEEHTESEFMYDYFGVAMALSDSHGTSNAGYDSVAIGEGDFAGIHVNFLPDAWDPTNPERNLWPDWLVELTDDAEQIFHYKDHPEYGAGVRLDKGHYRTVFLPWPDFFAVDSLENGNLVPRPGLTATIEKILEWFQSPISGANPTEDLADTPQSYHLFQNHPNPFNSGTKISYHLAEDSSVELTIYNILGQNIRTLFEGQQAAGSYSVTWDGKDYVGGDVSSGVYFYQLKVEDFVYRKRMLLLK